MGFPGRPSAGAAPALQPAPPAGPPAPPTHAGPPPPPPAPASARKFWVAVGGQSVLKTEAECAAFPPTTPAMAEDQAGGWLTLASFITPAPAAPAGTRAAFGGQRPAPAAMAPAGGGARAALFSGVEGAEIYRKGTNIREGQYVARVKSSEFKEGREANYVIVELELLVSDYDETTNPNANQEGTSVSVFVKKNDMFASNMKEIMIAVSGYDPKTNQPRPEDDIVTPEECIAFISKEQPYAGALVFLKAVATTTKKEGKPFTRVNWWACPLLPSGNPDFERLKTIG
jgi:hypothetical protein